MRLAISTAETLTDLKTDLFVANNNNIVMVVIHILLPSINRSIVYVFLTLYVMRILCQFLNIINYIHVCILMSYL